MSTQTEQSPLVCDLAALDEAERREHVRVSEEMFAALQEVKELPDGYGFRFPATAEMLQTVAAFIARERRCCPFYDFTVKVERESSPLWLHLTGREGVKEFVRREMKGQEQLDAFF